MSILRRVAWGGFVVGVVAGVGLAMGSEARGRIGKGFDAVPEFGLVLLMAVLLAAGFWLRRQALRDGAEGAPASVAERTAWSQMGLAFVIVFLCGMWIIDIDRSGWLEYLVFAVIAVLVLCFPLNAKRYVEKPRLRDWKEIPDDERERSIRMRGEYIARRTLDALLVALVLAWVLLPDAFRSLRSSLQIGATLLLPIGLANLVGESYVAWRHWNDRRA